MGLRRGLAQLAPVASLPCQRSLFASLPPEEEVCFLNAAYMTPSLAASEAAGVAGARRKSRPWELSKPDFYSGVEALRGSAGRLMGAPADCIAVVSSASYGLAVRCGP